MDGRPGPGSAPSLPRLHDHRARARFSRPELRTAAAWSRSPRSLAGDPSFERVTRSLWARLPPAARSRTTTAADQLVSVGEGEPQPILRVWERAALLQLHYADSLLVSHLSAAQLWGLPLSSSPAPWTHGLLGEESRFGPLESRPQLSCVEQRQHEHSGAMLLHKSLGLRSVLLRLLVVRTGFAEPSMNLPVIVRDGPRFVLDLAWREQRTALEYNACDFVC